MSYIRYPSSGGVSTYTTLAAFPATSTAGALGIALDTYILYIYETVGGWTVLATPGSDGDVFGPSSSTDNALARFDGTTGKLLQNSNAILSDAGALSLAVQVNVQNSGSVSVPSLRVGDTNANICGAFVSGNDLSFVSNSLLAMTFERITNQSNFIFPSGATRHYVTLNGNNTIIDSSVSGANAYTAIKNAIPFNPDVEDLGRDPINNVYRWRQIHGSGLGLGFATGSTPTLGNNLLWGSDGLGNVGNGTNADPDKVFAKTQIISRGSIGVGNSANATIAVGLLVKKIEIFDASGVSLGFIPVYAAIT